MLGNIEPRVRSVLEKLLLKQLAVKPEQLRPEVSFVRDLGADSLDMVDIVAALEEQLGLKIHEDDLLHMSTFGEAIAYLSSRLQTEQPRSAATGS